MTLLHSELERLQKNIKSQNFLLIALLILGFAGSNIAYFYGVNSEKLKTIQRAKKVVKEGKDCYTTADLEVITFGESQP